MSHYSFVTCFDYYVNPDVHLGRARACSPCCKHARRARALSRQTRLTRRF